MAILYLLKLPLGDGKPLGNINMLVDSNKEDNKRNNIVSKYFFFKILVPTFKINSALVLGWLERGLFTAFTTGQRLLKERTAGVRKQ